MFAYNQQNRVYIVNCHTLLYDHVVAENGDEQNKGKRKFLIQ